MLKKDELADPESCLNRAHDDEWLFVLMSRDPAMSFAIRAWVGERLRLGCNRPGDDQITEANRLIHRLET